MTRQTLHDELLKRLKEKRRFLQVLAGPRQVGKTTLARQVIKASKLPAHYASAGALRLR
ncbi:MAG: AAA family ATPase [Verrucomicrobiota bacterium]